MMSQRSALVSIGLVAWVLLSSHVLKAQFPVDEDAVYREIADLQDRIGTIGAKAKEAAKKLKDRGIEANDRRDYSTAIELYRKALEKDPIDAVIYYEMAFTQGSSGDAVAALENTFRAIALDPTLEYAYVLQASLEDDLGFPERALESYDRLLESKPDSYLGLLNKGITLLKLDRFAEAEAAFHGARKADPDHPSSYLRLAQAAQVQRFDYDEETYLEQFLARAGQDPRAPTAASRLEALRDQSATVNIDSAESHMVIEIAVRGARALWRTSKHRELNPEARGYRLTYEEEHEVLKEILLESWREKRAADPTVTDDYYDFLLKIDEAGHFDTFIYHQKQREIGPDALAWITDHEEEVNAFLGWAQDAGLVDTGSDEGRSDGDGSNEDGSETSETAAAETAGAGDIPSEQESTSPGTSDSETLVLEEGDLPALVFSLIERSEVMYSIEVAHARGKEFFLGETKRWKRFHLGTDGTLDCDYDLAAAIETTYSNPMSKVLTWSICFGPDDKEWKQLKMASRLGYRYRNLAPRFRGTISGRSDGEMKVVVPTDSHWMSYLLTKALWRRESVLQGAFGEGSSKEPSLFEETLAMRSAIAAYENSLANAEDPEPPDEYFDTLREIRNAGLLQEFVLFEILHKHYGVSLRGLDREMANRMERYLVGFVFRQAAEG